MYRVWNFVSTYSLLLILGSLTALVWANYDYENYHSLMETNLWTNNFIGHIHGEHRELTFKFLVNDLLMALFFAIAGKEVWEAVVLKDGSLRGKKAVTPLIATAGGILGPIAVYVGLAYFVFDSSTYEAAVNGWAIPTATDIAFSYLAGRVIFGAGHPAVKFLLLLAIADDAVGLIILAIFYPSGEMAIEWLGLSALATAIVYLVFNRLPQWIDKGDQKRRRSTWARTKLGMLPYAVAGALSWYGFQKSGIHPALGLLPIVATLPHADRPFGFFAEAEVTQKDLLNRAEHLLKVPVEVILFLFGLANAGVLLSAVGNTTALVFGGLLIGKPVGIFLLGSLGASFFGLSSGMRHRDLLTLGFVAAIGFTVSLFVASIAFPAGDVQDAAKMGALFSFAAAVVAWVVGRLVGVKKVAIEQEYDNTVLIEDMSEPTPLLT